MTMRFATHNHQIFAANSFEIGCKVLIKLLAIGWGFALLALCLTSCSINTCLDFQPEICFFPSERLLHSLPSAFPPLDEEEFKTEWGKELYIGLRFVKEADYYRALSSFKRAEFLIPADHFRHTQIEYSIFQAYYLAGKYPDALLAFDNSQLAQISLQFTALDELLVMLYDCYVQTNQIEHAVRILCLMETRDSEKAERLKLNLMLKNADFPLLENEAESRQDLNCFLEGYHSFTKSPQKARALNALLPGAGYYYVGQEKAAFTSFVINALFTAVAYKFFDKGYWAAGLITAGIEAGWYFGGINGAGIAANEYNERVYECQAKDFMIRQKLFPILMFQYAF